MGLVLFVFLIFPKTFEKTKNTKEHQIKQNSLLENTKKNKVFKGFSPTLGYGFVFLFVFLFSRNFFQNKKTFEKTKIQKKTKENQKHLRENKQVSEPPLDMGLFSFVFLVFSKVFTKQSNI